MDQNKFDAVLEYFKSLNITLPTDVRNAIEDAFRENDNIEGVECYHREDHEQFGIDLSPENIIILNTDGSSSGDTQHFFTYYGGVEHDLREKIQIFEDEELVYNISDIDGSGQSILEIIDDYTVIVVESVSWDSLNSKEVKVTTNLYIYCPISESGLTEEDLKYKGIYNEIKAVENGI